MPAPESEYGDAYGLPHEDRASWGAKAQLQRQAAALKSVNPSATQFQTQGGTPPTPTGIQRNVAALKKRMAPAAPQIAPEPAQQPAPRPLEQTAAKQAVSLPAHGAGQQPQSPLGKKYTRGYGPVAGLVPEDNPFNRSYNGGLAHYWRQLASLPNASPEIQWYARQFMENE